jgi:hypothetical protein
MKIAFDNQQTKDVILELLRPWSLQVTALEEAEVVFSRANRSTLYKKTVFIPDSTKNFASFVASQNLSDFRGNNRRQFEVPITENLSLTMNPDIFYSYGTLEHPLCGILLNEAMYFLGVDVIAEYYRILNRTFEAKP